MSLLARTSVRRVLIIDLDVHQGDGTAELLKDVTEAFTFSMHCDQNFPFVKQDSDLDISLDEGMDDMTYLSILKETLPALIQNTTPDLVLYDAGVDPQEDDRLGKLALTDDGIYERDRWILDTCRNASLPIAAVVGGGYSNDFDALADRHSLLHRAASVVCDAQMKATKRI